jgi:hypothetical protein
MRRQDPSGEHQGALDIDLMRAIRLPRVPTTTRVSRKVTHRKRSLPSERANGTTGVELSRGPFRTEPPQDVNSQHSTNVTHPLEKTS